VELCSGGDDGGRNNATINNLPSSPEGAHGIAFLMLAIDCARVVLKLAIAGVVVCGAIGEESRPV
jgi:hypothetical protein